LKPEASRQQGNQLKSEPKFHWGRSAPAEWPVAWSQRIVLRNPNWKFTAEVSDPSGATFWGGVTPSPDLFGG